MNREEMKAMLVDQEKVAASLHVDLAKLEAILREHTSNVGDLRIVTAPLHKTMTLLLEYLIETKREGIVMMEEHCRKMREAYSL
jgi:hypothetical protein